MDVIVVDEEYRQPIQRPFLTVVIDVFSRALVQFHLNVCFYPANGFLGFMPPRLRTKARERLLFFRSGVLG
jgi:hypothetical protein